MTDKMAKYRTEIQQVSTEQCRPERWGMRVLLSMLLWRVLLAYLDSPSVGFLSSCYRYPRHEGLCPSACRPEFSTLS